MTNRPAVKPEHPSFAHAPGPLKDGDLSIPADPHERSTKGDVDLPDQFGSLGQNLTTQWKP